MTEKTDLREQNEKVVEIEMERLVPFNNHPFKVILDNQMQELQDSIKKYEILNPIIVRPRPEGVYEIISGHRRKCAAERLGYKKVPVIIRMMEDKEAIITMVDSNLQRERISPSEKAFAYDGQNPATDATLPKYKAKERKIWTAEMLMQAIDACENKWLKVALHLAFSATVRMDELLGLTWDCVDISDEAIAENRAYIYINKQVERVTKEALEELNSKEVILVFPSQRKNNKTVRVMKTPKTENSERKIYIPKYFAQYMAEIKKEQDELKEVLGNEYMDYNLVMATTFGMPINGSYIREQMQKVIDKEGLPDVVFHSLRHTSVTYKLKLSGGDIKSVQGDSGHAQADMVTEVYGHIIDEDRRKNAERMEQAFYNRKNLSPDIHDKDKQEEKKVPVPAGVDEELLMKVLGNPEMAALLTSLAKTIKE